MSSNNSTSSLAHHSNASNSTITGRGTNTGIGKGSVTASRTLKRDGQDDGSQLTGFNAWSAVKVLEQHSEKSLVVSHPYAYIGDYVLPITLSADIAAEIAAYEQRQRAEREQIEQATRAAFDTSVPGTDSPHDGETGQRKRKGPPVALRANGNGVSHANDSGRNTFNGGDSGSSTPSRRPSIARLRRQERQLDWISQLRDKLQPTAEMGWYVVVVDDEERALDEDYEPYEPEYIEVFPSKKAETEAAAKKQAEGTKTPTSATGGGKDDSRAQTSGANSALSSRSRTESELLENGNSDAPRKSLGKRRNSVARLRGLFGLKEKQRVEKENKWEGAAEWEKMQRKQREQAGSDVKQPFPPRWEKNEKGGHDRAQSVNFSRPGTGNTEKDGYVERPGAATGRLSKLRR